MKLFTWFNRMTALVVGMTGFILHGAAFKVGEPCPAITLPSARDGRPMSVNDFRGRKMLLHLFASW